MTKSDTAYLKLLFLISRVGWEFLQSSFII
jgi:hypothetical protein